ncbi:MULTISPECIES: hypothetical protein [Microbacterium]|uniref:hypothetical protein n=1 Tax=Microbacterium sp. 4NA327F11 TaxID=2502229 RepID=UPI0010F5BBC9|nr:hypothetical protein [Microbacterium sp. 4NA327F11]
MRAAIRPRHQVTVTVEGESLQAIQDALATERPAGHELASAPVVMSKTSTLMTATGTFVARNAAREVEGPDLAAIRALTPDGWQITALRD